MNFEALKKEIATEEANAFIEKHSEVKRWLRKIESETSRQEYVKRFMRYCLATEKTPKELTELRKNSKDHEAEDLLDEFVDESRKHGVTDNAIWNIVNAAKSFYKWNYADLSRGAGKITRTKVNPYRTPDKESLRKFLEGANVRDKSLISLMACTSIAEGSIPLLKWKHVSDIKNDLPYIALQSTEIKGKGKGKYEGVEQHTFLTPHAKNALLAYKTWRERKEGGQLNSEDYMFTTIVSPFSRLENIHIRKIFERRSKESGIKFSAHDLRRFVQTQLETARLQPNWIKKILRHKVSGEENPYSQPKIEMLKEAYRTALPYLDLSEKPQMSELDRRKQQMRDTAKLLEWDQSKIAMLEQLLLKAHTVEELEAIPKRLKTITERTPRGIRPLRRADEREQDCQLIVSESELEGYLKRGFRYVATLPSGKILVSNE